MQCTHLFFNLILSLPFPALLSPFGSPRPDTETPCVRVTRVPRCGTRASMLRAVLRRLRASFPANLWLVQIEHVHAQKRQVRMGRTSAWTRKESRSTPSLCVLHCTHRLARVPLRLCKSTASECAANLRRRRLLVLVCRHAIRKGVMPICTVHGAWCTQTRRSERAPSLRATMHLQIREYTAARRFTQFCAFCAVHHCQHLRYSVQT